MKYSEEEKTIIFAKHFIKDNEGVFAMGKKETQILLNLITKQQKEIEEKDRLIDKDREEIMYYKMLLGENKRLN